MRAGQETLSEVCKRRPGRSCICAPCPSPDNGAMILKSETYHFPPPRPHPPRGGFKKLHKFYEGIYAHPGGLTFGVPPAATRPSRTLSASSRSAMPTGSAVLSALQLQEGWPTNGRS